MRKLKVPLFISISLIMIQIPLLAAVPDFLTTEAAIHINEVYVPNDLSSEMESYVVIAGAYPNGCYRWKGSEMRSRDLYTHSIKSVASVTQSYCIMVLIPFVQRIQLGKLVPGAHTLLFLNADGRYIVRNLEIK